MHCDIGPNYILRLFRIIYLILTYKYFLKRICYTPIFVCIVCHLRFMCITLTVICHVLIHERICSLDVLYMFYSLFRVSLVFNLFIILLSVNTNTFHIGPYNVQIVDIISIYRPTLYFIITAIIIYLSPIVPKPSCVSPK